MTRHDPKPRSDARARFAAARWTQTLGAVTAALAFSSPARSQACFLPDSGFASGTFAAGVTTADFDGDGDVDLAMPGAGSTISVWWNAGDATFFGPLALAVDSPVRVAHADLDGDGRVDLVSASATAGTISVTRSLGGGAFATPLSYAAGPAPVSVLCSDVDADGDADVVVSSLSTPTMTLMRNVGDGSFLPPESYGLGIAGTGYVSEITPGDLDGDGDVDLVTSNYSWASISLLVNQGGGTFTPQAVIPITGFVRAVACADLDGDGDADLATTCHPGAGVAVLTNQGAGVFGAPAYVFAPDPWDIEVADVDLDGDFDVFVADENAHAVSVLENTAGTFGRPTQHVATVGPTTRNLELADLDGDGDLDLVAVGDGVAVFLNCATTGRAFCLGDGGGTPCPCGNQSPTAESAGCLSSLGVGAVLRGAGAASLALDTFELRGARMPEGTVLYLQGTAQQAAGSGVVFGDGLQCLGGTLIRLGTATNASGASTYPGLGQQPVSVRGQITSPGLRTYQVWYRNAATFCTSASFNLSNGWEILWLP